jgi:hypothetical protein
MGPCGALPVLSQSATGSRCRRTGAESSSPIIESVACSKRRVQQSANPRPSDAVIHSAKQSTLSNAKSTDRSIVASLTCVLSMHEFGLID